MIANLPVYLGLDTGGTYTDAVLWADDGARGHIIASAKALTTRHDLSVGIAGAAGTVIAESGIDPAAVAMVSMSTTLATNALVEGQGGRVALVMAGFVEKDLQRDGLADALGADPVILLQGGHDVHGTETPLDMTALDERMDELGASVSAFAVATLFAVRNPAHENLLRERIHAATGLPVTCSHELTAQLGGPRRALTTLLNARLIALIDRLIAATQGFLEGAGIHAPLMVVRGDGALVSADFARERPIETILSGPAASLVGARHLTGCDSAIVADIGGTTTDIALIDSGQVRIDPQGAVVGGHRTMVEAVAMRTHGLGGDSQVALADGQTGLVLTLGPRRLVPLSLAAHAHGDAVIEALRRQVNGRPGQLDGRFAFSAGLPDAMAAGLNESERRLFERLTLAPQPLDRLLGAASQTATLDRLAARGLALIAGFTPTDAAHVSGRQSGWNAEAARLGAELLARRKDGHGDPFAASAGDMAARVLAAIARRSAEVILESVLIADGYEAGALSSPVVQRVLDGEAGLTRFALTLDRPVIGLGASAPLHYAELGARLGTDIVIPPETGVANAVGAVVGQVSMTVEAVVVSPMQDRFRVTVADQVRDFADEADALRFAEETACAVAHERAGQAGAGEITVRSRAEIDAPRVEGQRQFVEARIFATASGRARIASHADTP